MNLRPCEPDSPEAQALFELLDADIRSRFPGEPVNGIDPDEFRAAKGYLTVAFEDDQPLACGSFRPLDETTAEVKRMFVLPDCRGQGLATAILAHLEEVAAARAHHRIILETGNKQFEAIALYEKLGYHRIPVFGQYVGSPISVCFEKALHPLLKRAIALAKALDQEDYELARQHLADDCSYELRGTRFGSANAIIESYQSHGDDAQEKFEEIIYESRIEMNPDQSATIHYTDTVNHKGDHVVHRCRQHLQFNEAGLISAIRHEDLPGEVERLTAFKKKHLG